MIVILKIKSRCDADFVITVTDGTGGCHYDNRQCHQWQQSWHHSDSRCLVCARYRNSDTVKPTGPWTFADKNWVGPVKLLCIIMLKISQMRPKSLLSPVKAQESLRCLRIPIIIMGILILLIQHIYIKTVTWALSQYKNGLSRYGVFRYKDKTVMRASYLYNGNSYTGKTTSLYWDRALIPLHKNNIFMWVDKKF